MEIIAHWEVYDRYAGKSRPRKTHIDTDDIMDEDEWNNLSRREQEEIIEDEVHGDFINKINYGIYDYGI